MRPVPGEAFVTQLAIGSDGLDRAHLSCGHDVNVDRAGAARTGDDWYAAVFCQMCGRARAVVWVVWRDRALGAPA